MGVALFLAFGCWLVVVAAAASGHLEFFRFMKGRPVPVRGPRLAVGRLRRRLPDVDGRRGNFRGVVWHGMPDGLACQSLESIAVGWCRRDGDETVYEARLPISFVVACAGMAGFVAVFAAVMYSTVTRLEWVLLVPPAMILFTVGIGWLQVRQARKGAREMVWLLDGLLAELAEPREP